MCADKSKKLEITECEGCNARLIIGSFPEDLFIPLPGINIWNRESTKPLPSSTGNKCIKKSIGPSKTLTLCLDCFNGHVSGHRTIPMDVLGISIVKAPYTNNEKYLKVEGPTKVVNLLSDDYKSSYSTNKVVTESVHQKTQDHAYQRPKRKRKQIITNQDYLDDDDDDYDDYIEERISPSNEKIAQFNALNLGPTTTVNYLTIGNDTLGAMEMTDD